MQASSQHFALVTSTNEWKAEIAVMLVMATPHDSVALGHSDARAAAAGAMPRGQPTPKRSVSASALLQRHQDLQNDPHWRRVKDLAPEEETYLEAMHGADVYGAYAKEVPRLIPRIDGMKTLLDDFGKNFETQAKDE